MLIELFSLGVTAESLRAKRDRRSAISLQSINQSINQSIIQSINHFIVRRHDRTHTWTRKIQWNV